MQGVETRKQRPPSDPREPQEVHADHRVSVAKSVIDYELKDPEAQRALGIEPAHLKAGPR